MIPEAIVLGAVCVLVATIGVYFVAFLLLCVWGTCGLVWSLLTGEFFE